MQSYKNKILVDYLLLASLVIISLFASFFLVKNENRVIFSPDSPTYLALADQIQAFQVPNLSIRAPLYPLFLLLMRTFGGLLAVNYGQIFLGAVSILVFYKILVYIFGQRSLAWVVAAILAFDPLLINYQNIILSETLAIFMMLVFIYLHLLLTTVKSKKIFIFTLAIDFLLIMTKPIFAFLPLIMSLFHFLCTYLKKTKLRKYFLLALCLNFLFLQTYQLQNFLKNGFWGITTVKEVNLLGKMIQYGYLENLSSYKDSPEIVKRIITSYQESKGERSPYLVLSKLGIGPEKELIGNLSVFNHYMLTHHFLDFTRQTVRWMPEIFPAERIFYYGLLDFDNFSWIKNPISSFFTKINNFKFSFFKVWLLVTFLLYLLGFHLLSYRLSLLLIPVLYFLIVIAVFAYGEEARLRLPVELLLNMFIVFPFVFLFFQIVKIGIKISLNEGKR